MSLVTQEEFDKIVPFLKKHGRRIGARARAGCETSEKICNYYIMLTRLPDGMTFELLTHEIENYKKKYHIGGGLRVVKMAQRK